MLSSMVSHLWPYKEICDFNWYTLTKSAISTKFSILPFSIDEIRDFFALNWKDSLFSLQFIDKICIFFAWAIDEIHNFYLTDKIHNSGMSRDVGLCRPLVNPLQNTLRPVCHTLCIPILKDRRYSFIHFSLWDGHPAKVCNCIIWPKSKALLFNDQLRVCLGLPQAVPYSTVLTVQRLQDKF